MQKRVVSIIIIYLCMHITSSSSSSLFWQNWDKMVIRLVVFVFLSFPNWQWKNQDQKFCAKKIQIKARLRKESGPSCSPSYSPKAQSIFRRRRIKERITKTRRKKKNRMILHPSSCMLLISPDGYAHLCMACMQVCRQQQQLQRLSWLKNLYKFQIQIWFTIKITPHQPNLKRNENPK